MYQVKFKNKLNSLPTIFSTKRKVRLTFMFILLLSISIYSIVGRATGFMHVGQESLKYYFRYLTYQTTWFVTIMIGLQLIYSLTKYDKLSWTTSKFLRSTLMVYYMWVMLVAGIVITPFFVWGPEESIAGTPIPNTDASTAPWMIDNIFVHIVLNIMIIWDYFTWEDKDKEGESLTYKKNSTIWLIYPMIWLLYTWLIYLHDGWLPYEFMDIENLPIYAVILGHVAVGFIFLIPQVLAIQLDKIKRA